MEDLVEFLCGTYVMSLLTNGVEDNTEIIAGVGFSRCLSNLFDLVML